MTESDKLWHGSFKPNFTRTDKLVYKSASASEQGTEGGWTTQILIPSENSSRDVVVSSLRGPKSDNVSGHSPVRPWLEPPEDSSLMLIQISR